MSSSRRILPVALTASLALAACSPERSDTSNAITTENEANPAAATPSPSPSALAVNGTEEASSARSARSAKIVDLEGLGELRIGQGLPKAGSWTPRGAQIEGSCLTVSSPEYPGVYAIVTGGKVRRITIGQRSDVKLVEGIGVGSSEKAVLDRFPGFREEPHKYEEAPAKYLTTPGAGGGGAALRFEIGQDRKIRMFHVGVMPVLAYVEGCA